jgi:hypothetical protein
MTTIIDPTGTPTIVYNRSGTTIVSLLGGLTPNKTGGFSPIGNEGVDIPRLSETTVLLATTNTVFDGPNVSGRNEVFRLPSGADVGDIVEIYLVSNDSGSGPMIFPQIGEQILPKPVSDGTNPAAVSNASSECRFRKISSTTWVVIS